MLTPFYRTLSNQILARPGWSLTVTNPEKDGNLLVGIKKYGAITHTARIDTGDLNDAARKLLTRLHHG